MNKQLHILRAVLVKKQIDAMFITQETNRRYLSGFDGTAGYLIITGGKAILATDSRYWEQAEQEAPDFEIFKVSGSFIEIFPDILKGLGIKSLGFEGGDVTYEIHRALRNALKKKQAAVRMVALSHLVEAIRSVKEPEEIELMKKAAAITDAAFEEVEKHIKAGMTEKQVAWEMEKTLHEMGSEGLAFPVIVGSGSNAALPHAKPSDRVIHEGEPIVIDMGGKYHGYANDITRTVCVGKANAKFKKVYNTVLKAQTTATEKIKEGMTGAEADNIAREIINEAGYGEAFGHSLGHGVGLAEHEQPRLSPNSKDRLKEGMVFTVEPGIYLTGWGGVRIEDTVIMEEGKAVPLNKARKAAYR